MGNRTLHTPYYPYPIKCNICGGDVVYASNSAFYGYEHGNGRCYYCTNCNAKVGVHDKDPRTALGILATKYMRNLRILCHEKFDSFWSKKGLSKEKQHDIRNRLYTLLAKEMGLSEEDCHFSMFDESELKEAYQIVRKWTDKEIEMLLKKSW